MTTTTAQTPKRRKIQEREAMLCGAARTLLLEDGYHGISMDGLSAATGCPRSTIYRIFSCKDDIVVSLACEATEKLLELMRRAAAFEAPSRERALAIGEAVEFFHRLYPDDCWLRSIASGPVREKAANEFVFTLERTENKAAEIVRSVLVDAILQRDILLPEGWTVGKIAYAVWALVEGSYALIESRVPQDVLDVSKPLTTLYQGFNVLADGLCWRPLSTERNYRAVIHKVRLAVFPNETEAAYGEEAVS